MDNLLAEFEKHFVFPTSLQSNTQDSPSSATANAPKNCPVTDFFNFSNIRSSPSPKSSSSQRVISILEGLSTSQIRSYTPSKGRSAVKNRVGASPMNTKENSAVAKTDSLRRSSSRKNRPLRDLIDNETKQYEVDTTKLKDSKVTVDVLNNEKILNCEDACINDILFRQLDFSSDKGSSTDNLDLLIDHSDIFTFGAFAPIVKNGLIEEVLNVNKTAIDFGKNLPGKIVEETIELVNKSNEVLYLELSIEYLNKDLQNTNHYIYSLRSNYGYDYSEKKSMCLAPENKVSFKVALNVPMIKLKEQLVGEVKITAKNYDNELKINLKSIVTIPKIYCPKQLFSNAFKQNVINIAFSEEKTQERKLALRNDSDLPVVLELGFFVPPGAVTCDEYECNIQRKVLSIPAKGQGTVLLSFNQVRTPRDNSKRGKCRMQKVLYARPQSSSLVYSFPLFIETF